MYAENIKRQKIMLTTKIYINNLNMDSAAPGEKYGLEYQCPIKYYPQRYNPILSIMILNWNIIQHDIKLHIYHNYELHTKKYLHGKLFYNNLLIVIRKGNTLRPPLGEELNNRSDSW